MSTKNTLARLAADDVDPFDFIGRSANRKQEGAEPTAQPPPESVAPAAAAPVKQISVRVDAGLYQRLKLHLATTGEEQQELIARLISSHLDSHKA